MLKNAVNKTAKQTKAKLVNRAKKAYATKKPVIDGAMDVKKAKVAKPEAVIKVDGEQLELKKFRVKPDSYTPRDRPPMVKAKVLLSSKMKPLALGGSKAFIAQFQNGHVSVVQRKTSKRFPIKKLLSNSVPKMIGGQQVYDVVEPEIYDDLMANIQAEIKKVLK